ncbi:hypothetical protein BX616_004937, partial [Lobosporangium transversale]
MLGNGYKERLANAQNSIGPLLLNISKQSPSAPNPSTTTSTTNSTSTADSLQLIQCLQLSEDNEPITTSNLGSPLKHTLLQTKLEKDNSNDSSSACSDAKLSSVSALTSAAPALESNSAARNSTHTQWQETPQQHQHQQQSFPRISRLPSASAFGERRSSFAEQFPELRSPELDALSHAVPAAVTNTATVATKRLHTQSCVEEFSAFGASSTVAVNNNDRSNNAGSFWRNSREDRLLHHNPFCDVDGSTVRYGKENSSTSASTKTATTGTCPIQVQLQAEQTMSSESDTIHVSLTANSLEAVVVIQRAIRQFLIRKRAKNNSNELMSKDSVNKSQEGSNAISAISTAKINGGSGSSKDMLHQLDVETLQRTCLRQSAEIDQLKEMVTKMLLEAEEDRRKLRQRDREIEELTKQQEHKSIQSTNIATGFDIIPSLSSSSSSTAIGTKAARLANIKTASHHLLIGQITGSVGSSLPSPAPMSSFNDYMNGSNSTFSDDLYEMYDQNAVPVSASDSSIHPLSLSSRSNSVTSIQSQSHLQSLGLKVNSSITVSQNSQPYYQQQHQQRQQYHGLMDMIDSPTTELTAQDSFNSGVGAGRGLGSSSSSHGFNPQSGVGFPSLNHRSSGTFSTTSSVRGGGGTESAYDSPVLEQPSPYPWNAPSGLSHSQSWVDD